MSRVIDVRLGGNRIFFICTKIITIFIFLNNKRKSDLELIILFLFLPRSKCGIFSAFRVSTYKNCAVSCICQPFLIFSFVIVNCLVPSAHKIVYELNFAFLLIQSFHPPILSLHRIQLLQMFVIYDKFNPF